MHTEDEAKERWCPFARTAVVGVNRDIPPHNRFVKQEPNGDAIDAPNPVDCRCIASQCMAWRWRRRFADDAKDSEIQHVTGYCGLAGKP